MCVRRGTGYEESYGFGKEEMKGMGAAIWWVFIHLSTYLRYITYIPACQRVFVILRLCVMYLFTVGIFDGYYSVSQLLKVVPSSLYMHLGTYRLMYTEIYWGREVVGSVVLIRCQTPMLEPFKETFTSP